MVVVELDNTLETHCRLTTLGSDILSEQPQTVQHMVRAGTWFGSMCGETSPFSLVGCTVSPGFDFSDFELGSRAALCEAYPRARDIIEKLTVGLP